MQEKNINRWLSMHLTRPKSSKGRSRAAVDTSLCSGDSTDGIQRPPGSPESPVCSRPDTKLRSQSQPVMWQASPLSRDELLQLLQHAPPAAAAAAAAAPPSLNKYTVLPSIGRRQSQPSHMHEDPDLPTVKDVTQTSSSSAVWPKPRPPDPGPTMTKEAGSLLLAIRAPCGRRFQQHFEPTDTLLTVRTSAELRYGAQYGPESSIETMDVPRRTFTDMHMTLAQCGIFNRSVLCISQSDSVAEHE